MSDVPEEFSLEDGDNYKDDWPGSAKSWTTREQWRWLKATRPAYLAAQKSKNLAAYLESMGNDFFDNWSECKLLFGHTARERLSEQENDQLNEAIKKRREQLRIWHKNKDRRRPCAAPLGALLRAIGVSKKGGRLPQQKEMYSKDRYNEEVKPTVIAKKIEMEAELGRKLLPGERLNNVKSCTKAAYEEATTAVKIDIQKRLAQAKEDAKAGRTGRALAVDAERTPQQYQDAIDVTPQLLTNLMTPLSSGSSWAFSVVGAGPVPEDNGKIGTISAHFGHDPQGPNFAQVTPNFEEQYVVPIGRFAKRVFPREVQQARSLEASGSSTTPASSSSQTGSEPVAGGVVSSQPALPSPSSTTSMGHVQAVVAEVGALTPPSASSTVLSTHVQETQVGELIAPGSATSKLDQTFAFAPTFQEDLADALRPVSATPMQPPLDHALSPFDIAPAMQLITPAAQDLAPVPEHIAPIPEHIAPVPETMAFVPMAPIPENTSPVPENTSPVPENTSPVPENVSPVIVTTDPLTHQDEMIVSMDKLSGEAMDQWMAALQASDPEAYRLFMGEPEPTPDTTSEKRAPKKRGPRRTAAAPAAPAAHALRSRAAAETAVAGVAATESSAAPASRTRAAAARTATEMAETRAALSRSGREQCTPRARDADWTRNQNKPQPTAPPKKAAETPGASKCRKNVPPPSAPKTKRARHR